MYESNMFRRLIPAFAVIFVGVVFYIATKYTVNGLFEYSYCATMSTNPLLDPNSWGIATWIFRGMGMVVFVSFILWAWMIVTGRKSSGENEPRKPRKVKELPPRKIGLPWQ